MSTLTYKDSPYPVREILHTQRDSSHLEGFPAFRGIPPPSSPHTHTHTKAHEGLTMNNHAHLELATFLLGFMLSKLTCFVEVIHGIA